jgi:hypothetical protein
MLVADSILDECTSLDADCALTGAQQSCILLIRSYWLVSRSWGNFTRIFDDGQVSDEVVFSCMVDAHEKADAEGYILGQEILDLPVSLRHGLLEVEPVERFKTSASLLSALELVKKKWKEVMLSKPSPFENKAASFSCDVFSVEAYSWTNPDQFYNFKWRDVEISWYKYFGRSMSVNRVVSRSEADEMMAACSNAIELAASGHLAFHYD